MLVQTSGLYTPPIFEAFQTEYERSMAACTRALEENNTYAIAIVRSDGDFSSEIERVVVGDPLEQTASCNCGQFARTGVLCSHALKILDLMNIKFLPNHYVLKRWTREAKYGTIQDNTGKSIIEDPKLDAMLRYKVMSKFFLNLAYPAASDPECCILVDNALDCLSKQLHDKFSAPTRILCDTYNAQPNIQQDEELLSDARLKKKEVQPRSSKRHRSWLDKTRKYRKKAPDNCNVCC
jgi:zinc finger SWIM domain-containing protein 3